MKGFSLMRPRKPAAFRMARRRTRRADGSLASWLAVFYLSWVQRRSTLRDDPAKRGEAERGQIFTRPPKNQIGIPEASGFTLIELSVVLVIIAVIVGMTLGSGVVLIGSAKLSATQKKMAAIDQALMAYRIAYDQLPCPSDQTQIKGSQYYGTSLTSAGYCVQASSSGSSPWGVRTSVDTIAGGNSQVQVAEGGVPVVDLGLPADFMYDGWGNHIRYAVDVTMANTGGMNCSSGTCVVCNPVGSNSNCVRANANSFKGTQIGASCGQITIDGDAVTPGSYNTYTRSNSAIYALISHGPNGHGAFNSNGTLVNASSQNTDEKTNCNCTSSAVQNGTYYPTYVQASPSSYNTSNTLYNFDDIVTYKERWQMSTASDSPGNTCPRAYVSDYSAHDIVIYDLAGNYINTYGSTGTGLGAFEAMGQVVADNFGYLWESDKGNNRLQRFAMNPTGTTLTYVGAAGCGINGVASTSCTSANNYGYGTAIGQLHYPYGVAVDHNGFIWMADTLNHRVQKFDSNMNFVLAIGCGFNGVGYSSGCTTTGTTAGATYSTGWVNGAFYQPRSVAVDPSNNIWVADSANNRVQKFDSNGNWLLTIGYDSTTGTACETSPNASTPACTCSPTPCTTNGQFNGAYGVNADAYGNIWVSDYNNNRIQEFTSSGTYITNFTTSSATLLSFNTIVDNAGDVWLAAYGNGSIFKCYNASGTWTCNSYNTGVTLPSGISIPSPVITNALR